MVTVSWSLQSTYLSLPRRLIRPARSGGAAGAPSPSFWRRWKPAWQIKRGASWIRTNFDLHRSVALWSLPVAVTLAVSGVYFSLGNEVFRPVVRLFAPITPNPLQALPRRASPAPAPALALQAAVERARVHLPPSARSFLPWYASHVPHLGVDRVAFKEDGMRERLLRLRYEQLFIDDQTGELKSISGYDSGTGADRFLIWQYPLHTGRVLGWWGRVLISLAGLLTASLCVTGLLGFANAGQHLSAEDIYRSLLETHRDIGMSTIYRVLSQFEHPGLIKRSNFKSGKAVYELDDGHRHAHLLCLDCGRIEEFHDDALERRHAAIAAERGYRIKDQSLTLFGACAKPSCEHRPQ